MYREVWGSRCCVFSTGGAGRWAGCDGMPLVGKCSLLVEVVDEATDGARFIIGLPRVDDMLGDLD